MKHASIDQTHPGDYVRKNIIPVGMSVKDAAERLGIGRPALSNFLNGNSSLSRELALRLERAFGADNQHLLSMQIEYDRKDKHEESGGIAVRAFVPNFLTIKARQIVEWADAQIEARTHLPVLLRKLIYSTCTEIKRIDFPGFDNAQRKGSDGSVESTVATPWVPNGKSYWEFGTDKKPNVKAENDYNSRLESVDSNERADSTFVFVTPRNWPGKNIWENDKNNLGDWKAVRVYDASDLEQWLEQSVPTQIWFAEQISQASSGYETLELAWKRWADVCEPPLTPRIFSPSIAFYTNSLKSWLEQPSGKPFVISADSREEALAFLVCLFDQDELSLFKDQTAVFHSATVIRKLIESSIPFIPIVTNRDVERELYDSTKRLHCIVFRPHNAVDVQPDISLDLLTHSAFEEALTSMGVREEDVSRLARESGYSPTILRRRLSMNAAIKSPAWASDNMTAKMLTPLAIIGAWHAEPKADREIMAYLANRKYDEIEDLVAQLLQSDDSPVWSVGRYRGVASKIDALFSIASAVTKEDLDRFLVAAEYVLSESDPALDLPEKDRWAAPLYGKQRDHSSALRNGICESLVILSVYGDTLFKDRLGISIESQITTLIRKMLTPLTIQSLQSHDLDLPHYAEAAPNEFLRIIEEDLRSEAPIVLGLLKPVDGGAIFGSPSRTGILWGLECIAWNPWHFPRVVLILAQLSKYKIDDNWVNKPVNSLQALFRSWLPQTAASLDQRIHTLETLVERYPDIGWEVCMEQIRLNSTIGHHTYRPKWRNDASGAGQATTINESNAFVKRCVELLLSRKPQNATTLGDLVEALKGLIVEHQDRVWDLINEWSQDANDSSKAKLRERIRQYALTRSGRSRNIPEHVLDRSNQVYENLQPTDIVIRHEWLFLDHWVQESMGELENDDHDFSQRDKRIDSLRKKAVQEIWADRGHEGIAQLLHNTRAAGTVGRYTALQVVDYKSRIKLIRFILSLNKADNINADWCLQGILSELDENSRRKILQDLTDVLSADELKRLFACAPFNESTWRMLDSLADDIQANYWKNVSPALGRYSTAEITEMVDRLLAVGRPRAAFHAVHLNFDDIETSRLKRLLKDVATENTDSSAQYGLRSYYISAALDSLDGRTGVTSEEMAQLEFLYIDVLGRNKHGIPNLEAQIVKNPSLFVQALVFTFKRNDGGEDPPEWIVNSPEQKELLASAAYTLLHSLKKIPGTNEDGSINRTTLGSWLKEARLLCREYGRLEIGDESLGQLLSKAPAGEDGVWPCYSVCAAMEEIATQELSDGFYIGVRNARGAQWGEGGARERKEAERYKALAKRINTKYPFVGGVLEGLASSFDNEARWHDSRAKVRKRLQGF